MASQATEAHGRTMCPLSARLMQDLVARPWPGNVRELCNAAERYAVPIRRRPPCVRSGRG
ncbi:AAA-type ATPase lid domain-containing protein [Methylobacterium amylolyticum]